MFVILPVGYVYVCYVYVLLSFCFHVLFSVMLMSCLLCVWFVMFLLVVQNGIENISKGINIERLLLTMVFGMFMFVILPVGYVYVCYVMLCYVYVCYVLLFCRDYVCYVYVCYVCVSLCLLLYVYVCYVYVCYVLFYYVHVCYCYVCCVYVCYVHVLLCLCFVVFLFSCIVFCNAYVLFVSF